MFYGLDVHKDFMQVCALAKDGKKRRDYRTGATADAIEEFTRGLRRDDAVVLEATFHTWAIVKILRRSRARVVVADPAQVKAIASARIKTDKVDAHILAQLLRLDFLPEVELPTRETWALRQIYTHRHQLRRQSVIAKNSIHALLNRSLIRYDDGLLFTQKGYAWLERLRLPEAEALVLRHQTALLQAIQERLRDVDAEILDQARQHPDAALLVTIPGVDVLVAMGFLAAIDSIERFESPNKLAAYFGLVPRVRQSATTCYHGSITKAGSRNARWLAVEAAHTIARSSSPLAAAYHRIRHRTGHQIAVIALARKLVVLVWHVLTHRQPYRYAAAERTRFKLRRVLPIEARPASTTRDLALIYAEAGFELREPSVGETRAGRRGRAAVRRAHRAKAEP